METVDAVIDPLHLRNSGMLIEDPFDKLELTSNEVTNRALPARRREKIADAPKGNTTLVDQTNGLSRPSCFARNVADELDAVIVSEFPDRGTLYQDRGG